MCPTAGQINYSKIYCQKNPLVKVHVSVSSIVPSLLSLNIHSHNVSEQTVVISKPR